MAANELRSIFLRVAAFALVLSTTASVTAQSNPPGFGDFQIGPSKGEVIGAAIGIAAAGAGIGFGIYYVARRGRSITGCAVSSSSALQLHDQGDQQTYDLVGQLAGIKPGQRVRVVGRKQKKVPDAPRQFLVEKVSRDFGACKVQLASR